MKMQAIVLHSFPPRQLTNKDPVTAGLPCQLCPGEGSPVRLYKPGLEQTAGTVTMLLHLSPYSFLVMIAQGTGQAYLPPLCHVKQAH